MFGILEDKLPLPTEEVEIMTTEEKKEIIKLYDNGIGYKKIASIVGVSIGSIRNVLNDREERCPVCGKKLIFIAGKKKKRFCSNACRYQFWNEKK